MQFFIIQLLCTLLRLTLSSLFPAKHDFSTFRNLVPVKGEQLHLLCTRPWSCSSPSDTQRVQSTGLERSDTEQAEMDAQRAKAPSPCASLGFVLGMEKASSRVCFELHCLQTRGHSRCRSAVRRHRPNHFVLHQ